MAQEVWFSSSKAKKNKTTTTTTQPLISGMSNGCGTGHGALVLQSPSSFYPRPVLHPTPHLEKEGS